MSDTRPLLRDLIHIPDRVQTNDFVLKLSEGVTEAAAAATVEDYVVTPQLRTAFNEALGHIKAAVIRKTSIACYLDGSFGSGKSHFMAVLDLLLAGYTPARAIPELAGVVTQHADWMDGRRFLMVPYHMIGARDVESAILGGYAEHIRRLHPNAPVPGFYLGERLFEDARGLRENMGDAAFFARLNEGKADSEGWGDLGAAWNADRFASAMLETPEGEDRQRLVGDLIATYFRSYADVAATRGEAFVSLDQGLAIMSQHARALGYDAVVLFLDELILWLATRAGDVDFVTRQGSEISKLVEAQHVQRPIPIVSFVARQRDLRELIGDSNPGALQVRFYDVLKWWEARFERVSLNDRNLPAIAERRLLRPTSEAARQQMNAAFEEFANRRKDVLETLLGADGKPDFFRQTYPFSPALVEALIAASSVLQRERTALRLMLTLLVKRRDELRLGSLIPVGDLWDEIAAGDQPFSDGMRIQFDNAKKLWTQKLLPMLEQTHGVLWQDLQEERADPRVAARLQNDARLLKTLLLAALVPQVPALRALTAPRLAALNHGSVISPIPGQEGGLVLQKLRGWAARVGEIHITEESNPTISLQITGVDIAPILANAAQFDNDGTRRSRVQRIVFEALEIAEDRSLLGGQPFVEYRHPWRGTTRLVDLYFEVVLELPYDRLRGRPGAPVLVLGMPFDPKNRPPADHRAHAINFSDDNGAGGVVWQPAYLSDRALTELGTLVRIDHLLAGDRLNAAASMLSVMDREQARAVLKSQQSALHQRLRACLEVAYGIRDDGEDCIGTMLPKEERLISLDTFRPQMPVGATMKEAVSKLLDSLFADRYPAHPIFEQEVRTPALKKVLEEVQRAAMQPDQRQHIEDHAVRRILLALAGPLRLGQMGQTHFVLSSAWADHFTRMLAQAGGGAITVGRLRTWMDMPKQMGLTPEVQNLVILAFAAQADLRLTRNGGPASGTIDRTDDAIELQEQTLPDETTWAQARARAGTVFGLTASELRKGTTVAKLGNDLKEKAEQLRPALAALSQELPRRVEAFAVPTSAARLVTLRSGLTLLTDLTGAADPLAAVNVFVEADLTTSEAAVAKALASAGEVRDALASTLWEIIGAAVRLTDNRRPAAEGLQQQIVKALSEDEHVVRLRDALRRAQTDASGLLAETQVRPTDPRPEDKPSPFSRPFSHAPTSPDEQLVEEREIADLDPAKADAVLSELRSRVAADPDLRLKVSWRLTRRTGGHS